MISIRSLAVPLFAAVLSAPLMYAQDLSRYREFQFGMDLDSLAKQTNVKPSAARTIHQRPALIQELEWQPKYVPGASSPQTDPVRQLLFSFYNGELFRVVVNYDRYRIEGLTDEDMIEAISAKYGTATRPAGKMIGFPSLRVFTESEKVIACWEDAEYSLNLVRSSYQSTFGMVVVSKRLDGLARLATVEALRLDKQEAPQRELERQKAQDDEKRIDQAKARLANRAYFRP